MPGNQFREDTIFAKRQRQYFANSHCVMLNMSWIPENYRETLNKYRPKRSESAVTRQNYKVPYCLATPVFITSFFPNLIFGLSYAIPVT